MESKQSHVWKKEKVFKYAILLLLIFLAGALVYGKKFSGERTPLFTSVKTKTLVNELGLSISSDWIEDKGLITYDANTIGNIPLTFFHISLWPTEKTARRHLGRYFADRNGGPSQMPLDFADDVAIFYNDGTVGVAHIMFRRRNIVVSAVCKSSETNAVILAKRIDKLLVGHKGITGYEKPMPPPNASGAISLDNTGLEIRMLPTEGAKQEFPPEALDRFASYIDTAKCYMAIDKTNIPTSRMRELHNIIDKLDISSTEKVVKLVKLAEESYEKYGNFDAVKSLPKKYEATQRDGLE